MSKMFSSNNAWLFATDISVTVGQDGGIHTVAMTRTDFDRLVEKYLKERDANLPGKGWDSSIGSRWRCLWNWGKKA